jgi:hypothetical protein
MIPCVGETDLESKIDSLIADVSHLRATLDEYLPMLRAYLAPEDGPRGWFMRRQMAKLNGDEP